MSDREFPTPELNVFLIASHVVYGYVGNKTASFVLQALGCNVSALNTVHFSNHTGYGSWAGTKQTGDEMWDVYNGLVANGLADAFDMLLTGYCPGAPAVEAAGRIALDLKHRAAIRPGSFFWVLDPVMGDNGRLYVDPGVVPVYQSLVPHADLIVPNQFELETLAGLEAGAVDSFPALRAAIADLHARHRTAHVLVTSVRFAKRGEDGEEKPAGDAGEAQDTLSVVGSTRTSDGKSRAFRIDVHDFDCFFSGTGDLLASLMAVRLREAAAEADLLTTQSWLSPDTVTDACQLPLAKATLKALASMHTILQKTMDERNKVVEALAPREEGDQPGVSLGGDDKGMHKIMTRAAEVRIVRNVGDLLYPKEGMFEVRALDSHTLPHNRAGP